ncbi:MAG TPA: hypothetical protein VMZ53_03785 [Kofleriaceae bacterium]|nr:hypothetical protein [Kofleriaceae bacterium]
MRDRAPIGGGTVTVALAAPSAMTWSDFQQRHPEWRGDYWAECRALYAGGDRLLGDKAVLERLFPMHLHEVQKIYEERKKRSHYYPYAGTIIDHLLAGLGTDPLRVSFALEDDQGKRELPPAAKWWERWVQDVTDTAERPSDYGLEDDDDGEDDDEGGTTMHSFIVDVLREALQTRTAWVLADLPPLDPDAPAPIIDSKLAAEQLGKADPYLCVVPAEQVIDWQTSDDGKRLEWVIVMTQEQIRPSPKERRGLVRHTYVIWDAEVSTKYQIDIDPANLPAAEHPVPVASGPTPHGFGRVPIERLVLPEGLFAMGKLHSLAREHFNKRCAMSWAEYKSLFAVLYEFLGPEDGTGMPVPMAQMDGNRAANQIRGQGYTQVRGKDDDARFVGPDVAPFKEARESCNDAMREMHRVMFSMALSANMDSAALQRSGDSKAQDSATTAVLLDAFGQIVRRFFRRMLVLAALGRGEAPPKCRVEGLEQFDVSGVADAISEAVELLNGVPILSPLFRELFLARLYTKVLGDVSHEQTAKIREQIRDAISAEETAIAGGLIPGVAPGGPAPGPKNKPQLPEDAEPDEDEDAKDAKEKQPRGYSSKRKPKR